MRRLKCVAALLAGLTAITLGANANAQNALDAPISRQPTVGSELDRGSMAGFDCGIKHVIDRDPFIACVNDLIEINRQKSTLSEPFELAVYLAALHHAAVQKMPLNSDHNFPFWHDRAIKLLVKTKLSMPNYCKGIGDTKCDPAEIDSLSYGVFTAAAAARKPAASPAAAPAPTPARAPATPPAPPK